MNYDIAQQNNRHEEFMSGTTSHAKPIVFVVGDDISVRESLEAILRREGWQAETFASAQEFLARPRPIVPSCLVLDLPLPDLNGLALQRRLAMERTDMPIMFIAGDGDVFTSVQAMKAGAVEFLMKPFEHNVLLDAIRKSLNLSRLTLAREMEMQTVRDRYASLTGRERQVLTLIISGLLNKQVAAELGISEITVKAHRRGVMQKMQAPSFAELVRIGTRLGPHRAGNSANSAKVAA
jgi:FixJ family two-component response regulator